jgi:hypothetical protein
MRRAHLIYVAWLLFVLAWFLPVYWEGMTLPAGLPGWEAFRIALCPWWPYQSYQIDPGLMRLAAPVSALTCLVMLVSPLALLSSATGLRRVFAVAAGISFLLNASWLFSLGPSMLRVGYYFWWISFAVASVALFPSSSRAPQNQAAAGM